MCGIVGFLNGQTDYKERQARKDKLEEFMKQGLLVDSLRGMDGTGVARVERKSLLQPAEVFKKAIPSSDFLQLRGTEKILGECDDVSIMIGHNRFSTRGAFKGDQNAHPFQVDHITLVHNGGITGYHQLTKKNPSDVDSSYVAGALSEEEPDVLLPKLYGSYSLVWHDARDGSLNMARNEERPMVLVKLGEDAKDWPALLFGSEPHMLLWLMARNGMKYHDGFTSTAIHTWYKFRAEDPFNPVRTAYTPATRTSGGNPHSFQKGRAGTESALPTTGGSEDTEDTSGTQTGTTDARGNKLSAKERKWAQRLSKAGLRYGESVFAKAVEFTAHRKDAHSGTGYFTIPSRQLDIQVHNLRRTAWDLLKPGGWAVLRCQTAREVKATPGTHVVIATWIGTARERGLGEFSRVTGPHGTKINRSYFRELTEDGCSVCTGVINPHFADDMLWRTGGTFPEPICHECAKDGSVRLKFGLLNGQSAGRTIN